MSYELPEDVETLEDRRLPVRLAPRPPRDPRPAHPGWTDHTPLGHELHRLNHNEPAPFLAPSDRTTTAETDTPQILREENGGVWQITTESTTTSLLDLDRGRIGRRPGNPVALPPDGNGDHPRPPVKLFDGDGAWTGLDHLLRCQTGDGLVALDRQPGALAGGYRLSTPVTHIQRTDAATRDEP